MMILNNNNLTRIDFDANFDTDTDTLLVSGMVWFWELESKVGSMPGKVKRGSNPH